jgi:hypothetical protein
MHCPDLLQGEGVEMPIPRTSIEWQKTLWKIVSNPAVEVLAAIVAVMFSAWIVVQTETEHRNRNPFPVPVVR